MIVEHAELRVHLAGYWHSGTGRGDGAGVDAVVQRGPEGLPYLPGKHIKGLLRHTMVFMAEVGGHGVDLEMVADLFGRTTKETEVDTPFVTEAAALRFGSARLPEAWRAWARTKGAGQALPHLFTTLQSTALKDGVVAARTLRSIEVTAPMELAAHVGARRHLSGDERRALSQAVGLVRRVGKHRTRGLGRARLRLSGWTEEGRHE